MSEVLGSAVADKDSYAEVLYQHLPRFINWLQDNLTLKELHLYAFGAVKTDKSGTLISYPRKYLSIFTSSYRFSYMDRELRDSTISYQPQASVMAYSELNFLTLKTEGDRLFIYDDSGEDANYRCSIGLTDFYLYENKPALALVEVKAYIREQARRDFVSEMRSLRVQIADSKRVAEVENVKVASLEFYLRKLESSLEF